MINNMIQIKTVRSTSGAGASTYSRSQVKTLATRGIYYIIHTYVNLNKDALILYTHTENGKKNYFIFLNPSLIPGKCLLKMSQAHSHS